MSHRLRYPKPDSLDDNLLDGILRNVEISVFETSHYYTPSNGQQNEGINIVKNDFELYWHSLEDPSGSQYVEIKLNHTSAIVTSYMFSSGNNVNGPLVMYPKNWNLECSLDNEEWFILKQHQNSNDFSNVKQTKIYDIEVRHVCNYFRIHGTGVENHGRHYMYAGPIELYGLVIGSTISQMYESIISSFITTLSVFVL